MNLDEAVEHIDKVKVFKNLRPGTFVWVQFSAKAMQPHVIEQVREAMVDVMSETGCRMLMTPADMIEGMKVLTLSELLQMQEMFNRAVDERMESAIDVDG